MNCRDDQCNSIPTGSLHSRRGIITALASAALLAPSPSFAAADASADDERFMRIALDEARQADSPFGAVIVRDGQVLARGRNLRRTNDDPTAHGEMTAIKGRKPVAKGRPRYQIPKRHRGHRNAGPPRRLIGLVTKSPA